ncbi:MAG TPA: hypothetical protein VMH39_14660 [Gemmatimonadaceae bacterium]|nr:hypothetical protein [Gemmatimonadaceae bacterium]
MPLHAPRVPTVDEVLTGSEPPIPAGIKTAVKVLGVVGAIAFVAGLFVAPDRVWSAFHADWLFFTALSTGGVTFVAVQRITTARWSRAVIRFMEGYVAFLPVSFVLLLVSFTAGRGSIFWWSHGSYPNVQKATYFSPAFLISRDLALLGAITILGVWFVYRSVRLDVGRISERGASWAAGLRARMRAGFGEERREIHSTHSLQGKLAVFLVLLYGYGWSVMSWDLSMGLSPHFQSTLYSWWFFMGGWLCALMLFALLVLAWNRLLGTADGLITETHFHDIGKLCFAFTAFWGYLTFGQYLVIWYGNMGEETSFMRLRLIEPWMPVTVTSIVMVFLVPFFGLLSRAAKVFKPTLALFAISSLIGMWLMRYIEVYPSEFAVPSALPFGGWELGVLCLYIGLWGWCYVSFMDAFPRMRVTLMTSAYRDEVQVPVNPETMEPLPAHE